MDLDQNMTETLQLYTQIQHSFTIITKFNQINNKTFTQSLSQMEVQLNAVFAFILHWIRIDTQEIIGAALSSCEGR